MRIGVLIISGLLVASVSQATAQQATPPAPRPPSADVTGRWIGVWTGYTSLNIDREDVAEAVFTQAGSVGSGRMILQNAMATDAPQILRRSSLNGVPIVFEMSGADLRVKHALGEEHFTAQFTVKGDQLVGQLGDPVAPFRITLRRAQAQQAEAPPQEKPKPDAVALQLQDVRSIANGALGKAEEALSAAQKASSAIGEANDKAGKALAKAEETDGRLGRSLSNRYKRKLSETVLVTFAFNKSDLDSGGQSALEEMAKKLSDNPNLTVDLGGHTDSRGTDAYNLALSDRRKETVRRFLVDKGVELNRIFSIGFGESKPVADNANEAGRTQNRRVAIGVLAPAE